RVVRGRGRAAGRGTRSRGGVARLRRGRLLAAGPSDRRRDRTVTAVERPGGRTGRWRPRLARLAASSEGAGQGPRQEIQLRGLDVPATGAGAREEDEHEKDLHER